MPTLYLTRAGVAPVLPVLGHIVAVPPAPKLVQQPEWDESWPEDVERLVRTGDDDALMVRLGHDKLLRGVGKPDHLQFVGLHDPTPWEARFVLWALRSCGVESSNGLVHEPLPTGPFGSMTQCLADPVLSWPAQPPKGVELVVGATSALEALGVVRAVRTWMLGQEPDAWASLCDDVLVLLPSGGARVETWRREFERHGLPARTSLWLPISDTAVGRWLMALAELGGWRRCAMNRDVLRSVLLAPMWVHGEHISRSDLRGLLRSLRRPRVSLDQWKAHVHGYFEQRIQQRQRDPEADPAFMDADLETLRARRHAILGRVDGWLSALEDATTPGYWNRLLGLLGADKKDQALTKMSTTARVRAGADALGTAVERCKTVLLELAGQDTGGTLVERRNALRDALAGSSLHVGQALTQGVRIQTYATWDGRGAAWTVLAGLEEGGHPQAPGTLSLGDQRLHDALQQLTPAKELARQARAAARAAAASTTRLTLAWAQTDAEGSDTFPGALLAGRPELTPWAKGAARTVAEAWTTVTTQVQEKDAVPGELGEAVAPTDLLLFPPPADLESCDDQELVRAWQAAGASTRAAREVRAERAGKGCGDATREFGAFTGRIGTPVASETYSPTALEDMGQCAAKYFLARVLGAKKADDAGAELDAAETGSLLHEAMASAAQDAIRVSGAWQLSAPETAGDEERNAWVDARLGEVSAGLTKAVLTLQANHPTLSRELLDWTVARWKVALRRMLSSAAQAPTGGLFPAGPVPAVMGLPDETLLAAEERLAKTHRGKLEKIVKRRDRRTRAEALIARARLESFASKAAVKAWYDEFGKSDKAVGSGEFVAAALVGTDEAWAALTAGPLLDEAEVEGAQAMLARAFRADRMAVRRSVRAAEWQFGRQRRPDDGADPKSVACAFEYDLGTGETLRVGGRVDRLDGDLSGDMAVVDYKSGKSKGDGKLAKTLGQGLHLQLPLYALAAEALLDPPHSRAEIGRLEFVRVAKEGQLWLAPDGDAWQSATDDRTAPIDPLYTRGVVQHHLTHTMRRLKSGTLPLLPRLCPRRDNGGYCDLSKVCGFDPTAEDRFSDPDPQPSFSRVAKPGSGKEKKKEAPLPPEVLAPAQLPPDAQIAHAAQEQACKDALRLDADVVVSAGAGAGKTRLLVERYLAALQSGCTPDQILAITFTRKATAEMRYRVRRALLERRADFKDDAAFRDALLGIGAAPILTIDAFAGRILQQFVEAEVQVSTDLKAYRTTWVEDRLLRAVASARVGDASLQGEAKTLSTLLEAWPVSEVRAAVSELLGKPDALAGLQGATAESVVQSWLAGLNRGAAGWQTVGAELTEVAATVRGVVDALDPTGNETMCEFAGQLETACRAVDRFGALGLFWGLGAITSAPGKNQAAAISAQVESVKGWKASWIKEPRPGAKLAGVLKGRKSLEDLAEALGTEARVTVAVIELATAWQREFDAEKVEQRLAGFDDVLAQALTILTNRGPERAAFAQEFRARFDYRQILVDEFQDTNGAQVKLVEGVRQTLAESGDAPRLFLVGDPKQSIYRFRGAEVDVFERELATASADRLQIVLPVGKRARPALTRSLDLLFERVLAGRTAAGELADPGAAVPWQALAPRWKADDFADDDGQPCVELLELSVSEEAPSVPEEGADDDEQNDATSASRGESASSDAPDEDGESEDSVIISEGDRAVGQRIGALLAEMQRRPGCETDRSPVAVLTHSWKRAQHWAATLQSLDIPAFVQGGRGLLLDEDIQTLMHVLDALEADDDDIAWAGILRGALVGISDTTLLCLRRGYGLQLSDFSDGFKAASARNRLSTLRHGYRFSAADALAKLAEVNGAPLAPNLSAAVQGDEAKLSRLSTWWQTVARSYGLVPLDATVRRVLEDSHYAPVLFGRGGYGARQALANVRTFLSLVEEVAAQPGRTPGEVIRALRQLCEAGDDPAAGGGNLHAGLAVTVTVVHQAKGLEWDCVVLPDLALAKVKGGGDHVTPQRIVVPGSEPVWVAGSRLTTAKDPFATSAGIGSAIAAFLTKPAERAESRRLLYVACTRAKERLVLVVPGGPANPEATDLPAIAKSLLDTDVPCLWAAKSWLDDLEVALRTPQGQEPIWQAGRDFFYTPTPEVSSVVTQATETTPASSRPSVSWRTAARASCPPLVHPVNPSKLLPKGLPPKHEVLPPTSGLTPPVTRPFVDKRREGTAVHRAFELWAYRGELTAAAAETAVDELGVSADLRDASVQHVLAMIDHACRCQPALAEELREAAARGEVLHETTLRLDLPDSPSHDRIEASIDLLYRGRDRRWHLLDYKASEIEDDEKASGPRTLATKCHHYYPQVEAYAANVQRGLPPGETLGSFGLWFVKDGAVARWSAAMLEDWVPGPVKG